MCSTQNINGVTVNGLSDAISIVSAVTDNIMQNYLWLADTAGSTVYKVSSELSLVHRIHRERRSSGGPVFEEALRDMLQCGRQRFANFQGGPLLQR